MTQSAPHYNASMPSIRVLYDGWPLLHEPLGAAAWQLRTLLALAGDDVQPLLALPTEPETTTVSRGPELVFHHTHNRGEWEQRILPRLAQEHEAKIIHTTGMAASLFGKAQTVVSPGEVESAGLHSRLDEAQGRGGLARAQILWPQDLPPARMPGRLRPLPPVVHLDFKPGRPALPSELSLPETYLLYQGSGDEALLLQLLESWTWAAASIGEYYPLVMIGLSESAQKFIGARAPEFHVQDSVRVLANVGPEHVAAIIQNSEAQVYLGPPAPWGNPLRHALACGKAIVAQQEANTEAIVGSAAYLTPAGDLRAFGAAMITVVVDEKAREGLEGAAQKRSAHWSAAQYKAELLKIYEELV